MSNTITRINELIATLETPESHTVCNCNRCRPQEPAPGGEATARPKTLSEGVWFQSAVSGLWYEKHGAAGTLLAVKIDGKHYPLNAYDTLAAQVEKLRDAEREQRAIIQSWQHHADRLAKILGCIAIDETIEETAQLAVARVERLETEKASLERSCEASINAALDLSVQVAELEELVARLCRNLDEQIITSRRAAEQCLNNVQPMREAEQAIVDARAALGESK